MSNWLISSVQQYTLDRLRVSFSMNYPISRFNNLSCKLYDSALVDISDKLLSIKESNDWELTSSTNVFDVVLNKNTSLTEGIYTFNILENDDIIYSSEINLNFMEDIRTAFDEIKLESLDTIYISFKSLYEDEIYQSREMLSSMKFSCIDESGVSYSDVFESFSSVIENIPESEEPITEVKIKLNPGRVLPQGYYTVRLTSRYKSRTFSILEKDVHINFMTTTPPTIASSYITKKASGEYILTVAFGSFIEKNMLESATRLILRSDGKNVSSYFNADRIAVTTVSTAGVSYIARLDIPLVSEFYVLQKGKYTICYVFPYDYVEDISSEINTDWCLKAIPYTELTRLDYLTMRFPETVFYKDGINLKYDIEIDGESVTDPAILDAFSDIKFLSPDEEPYILSPDQTVSRFYITIENKRHLKDGTYSFIFYYPAEDDKEYKYIANFNFKTALTPNVKSIYQSDIDRLTVELEKPLPIDVVEFCKMSLYDEYGNIDFSSRLESIHDSNIWEPGQIETDRFYVMISGDSYLSSGRYNSNLIFGDVISKKFAISLTYMEIRRGLIESITQESLSKVCIHFSETQTRKFLLTTKLMVERKVDGADFTDRFELLENVIKSDQYVINDLNLPMNHESTLPEGRYTFSFIWKTSDVDYVTVYSFDVNLGYMTSSPPEISATSTFIDSDGLLNVRVQFGEYLEKELFDKSIVSLVDSDDTNIISKMTPKEEWKLVTTVKKGITSIKNITMKALDKELKFEKDFYTIDFSWDGVIEYLENIHSKVYIDYILPLTVASEVVALNTSERTARLYFEFDQVLQFAFFENLKVQVFNEYGQDQTSIFDTIQHSNNIGPDTPEEEKVPTNNINLNVLNITDLQFGTYTFIFYHENNGIRTSEYKALLDIMAAISPSIKNMEQVGIDTLLINLKSSIPRMILETDSFEFVSFKKVDYTSYFKSIDASNDWDESVREVSSFYVKLKNGYKLGNGSYSFTMFADSLKLDQCDIELDYMEGATVSIDSVEMINLSTLEINFSEEQSTLLFKTLILQVLDEDGNDVSDKFNSLLDIIKPLEVDYFESIQLKVIDGCSLAAGNYTFNIIKPNTGLEDTVIMSELVPMKYMSATYPLLYDVSATKLDNGNDGIIMTFIPQLELDLFTNSGFTFSNISGMSVLDKFEPISEAYLDTYEKDGITYINYAILEFDPTKTLNKDKYMVGFNWIGDYAYMRNLSCEVSLDYILFPVKSIDLTSSDTVEIIFNKFLKKDYLKECELVVKSLYKTVTEEGTVITEVDFTDQFKTIKESNNFNNLPDDINKLSLSLKDKITLPESTYRFIIAEKIDGSSTTLQYAYAGSLDIEILISSSILNTPATITQVSYDTLKIKFDSPQNIKFIDKCNAKVFTDTDTPVNLSAMFKSIKESNKYVVLDEYDNVIGYDYYIDGMNRDSVIDEIHYTLKEANFIYLKLKDNCAIPYGTYNIYFESDNKKYFESKVSTTFMTQSPPDITNMEIRDGSLVVTFYPYAEVNTLCQSEFHIMSNKGLDASGNIVGDDITSYFNPVLSSNMTKITTEIGIEYVSSVELPISPSALIASGKYRLTWNFSSESFLPDIIYDGSLNVVAKGIKSALTYNFNTIKVTLDTEYKWSFLKELSVGITNSKNENCSDLFQSIIDSNPSIKDDELVNSFFLMVEEGEEIISDTYTFTLSYETSSIEGEDIQTTAFNFMMSIVYLADEFPVITAVDNLSTQNYTITKLTNMNLTSAIGRYIQRVNVDEKVLLTDDNASEYLDTYVKLYDNASIDKLTIRFDREVNSCLLNALDHVLINSDGNDVTSYFNTVRTSNSFKDRSVLDTIKFTFKKNIVWENLRMYKVSIYTADGRDLSGSFMTKDDSNTKYTNSTITNTFFLNIDDDNVIESYDAENLKIVITDTEEKRVTGFTYKIGYKDISSSSYIVMKLASRTTVVPGIYDLKLSYQNEQSLEDAVTITPFSYSDEFPFLSNNIGKIVSVDAVDLSTLSIKFSEDLPTGIFSNMICHVYNEDNVDIGNRFEKLSTVNDFTEGAMLSEMNDPFVINMKLLDDKSLQSGIYTFSFETKIVAIDEDEDNPNSDYYKLWSYTTRLDYMSNDKPNNITEVSLHTVNTLKVSLERSIDLSLLQNFKISLENNSNGYLYSSDSFTKLSDSNNFGKYVLLTDNRYLLVSLDGVSWTKVDTGQNYAFNDILYDKENDINIIVCSNGKVITFKKLEKTSMTVLSTPTTKNLTSITKAGNYYLVSGNDGVILRGSYNDGTITWVSCVTGVTKTITKIAAKSEDELVAVGYGGVILYSNNGGLLWNKVNAAIASPAPNLTDVIYYNKYTIEGEVVIPENKGFYVTGTGGTLLYSKDGNNLYSKISIGTSKSLYSVAENGGNLIVVGDSGVVYRTTDTRTWKSIASKASYSLRSIRWCDTKFIICGSSGKWLTSITGENWTQYTSIGTDTLKNVAFLDSQYDNNRNVNYFYLKLNKDCSIGRVNLYTGTVVPNETNNPEKYWVSSETKRTHVGDIYTMFETEGNTSVISGEYQYTADKLYDENEDDSTTVFSWKECSKVEAHQRFSGEYTMYINLNDDANTLWNQKEKINLTYLTNDPGEITSTTLVNPTTLASSDYVDPYIHVQMDRGDEEAIYYASYEIKDSNGVDYTNRFVSLHASDLTYSSALKINGVNIPKALSKEFPPAGDYIFTWKWTTVDSTSVPLKIKSVKNNINSIMRMNDDTSGINVKFDTPIDRDYFYKVDSRTGVNDSKVKICIYHTFDDVIDTSVNYFSLFSPIENTTSLISDKIDKLTLKVSEGNILIPGSYAIMISNVDYNLDTETEMIIMSRELILEQELCNELPNISIAKLLNYTRVVNPIVEKYSITRYNSYVDPNDNPEMLLLSQNWLANGEADSHVGDTYTNVNTNKTFSYVLNKISGDHYWEEDVTKPCLCVSFGDKPLKVTSDTHLDNIKLLGSDSSDITSYVNADPSSWEYETTTIGGNKYLSKIAMPVEQAQTFFGASDVQLQLNWTSDCIYENLTEGGLTLPARIASYGNIKSIAASDIPEVGTANHSHALYIEFTQPVLSSMLLDSEFTLKYKTGDNSMPGDEYTDKFLSIKDSNPSLSTDKTVESIYLLLEDRESIPEGTYDLEIVMQKPSSAITEEGEDTTVVFNGTTPEIPWLTSVPPTDISVTRVKLPEFHMPVLKIAFSGALPAITSLRQDKEGVDLTKSNDSHFTIKVIKQDTGEDYSACFINFATQEEVSSVVYNLNEDEPEYVDSVCIPMHRARGLLAGVYDVWFNFPNYSKLGTIPGESIHRSVTVKEDIISLLGKVSSFHSSDNQQELEITVELIPEIANDSAIANSQLGKTFGIRNFKALMSKLTMKFEDENLTDATSALKVKPKVNGNTLTYSIRNNNKIEPGSYSAYFTYNSYEAIDRCNKEGFRGLIKNTAGKATGDDICYRLVETYNGVTRIKMFSKYSFAEERINTMIDINERRQERLEKCKKCKANIFLSTSSISAQFDKYGFPLNTAGDAVGDALHDYYSDIVSKGVGCNCPDFVAITKKDSNSQSYQCKNYKKAKKQYEWDLFIATRPKDEKFKANKKKASTVYFAYIDIDGVELDRAYSATKKGKKSDKYKAYIKQLKKHIKAYKKKVSKCQKCRKYEIANKSGTTITWTTALFNIDAMGNTKFLDKISKAFKKKKVGCSKASFKFVEKDANHCKLSCKNYKKKVVFSYGAHKGTFIK